MLTLFKAQKAQTLYVFFAGEIFNYGLEDLYMRLFNNYLTTLELEELDDCLQACIETQKTHKKTTTTQNKKKTNNKKTKKKNKHRLSQILSVSAVVHLYSFSTKDQKKQVSIIRKYHDHTLQTRPDIIIQYINL